jgi:hydroxyacylglutathione hydrolase
MLIEQIYTGCLAQGSYYIESNGEAAVIDPLRETGPYLERAARSGATIKYILETHFHADFVSGHVDLSKKTGATIVYGPNAQADFPFMTVLDGEELKLGHCNIRLLYTPGHTLESSCYLLKDEKGRDKALFTGDTLFIGDVGRPDLAQHLYPDMTPERLAGHLYDSLHNKIMPLGDHVLIYPGHGAGSACGKNIGDENFDSLGHQKKSNYALKADLLREDFIEEVTSGLSTPPAYFPMTVRINQHGASELEKVLASGKRQLDPKIFEQAAMDPDVLVLDTREGQTFAKDHIPGSINIDIDGNFAPWAGALIQDPHQRILLVTDTGREGEAITRLARVGLDHCIGYLEGGIRAWKAAGNETDRIDTITPGKLAGKMLEAHVSVLDVRRNDEFALEHVLSAKNVPLDNINQNMSRLDKDRTYYIYCAGGYRSMIFNSILRARGYRHLIDVNGGLRAIKQSGAICITNADTE